MPTDTKSTNTVNPADVAYLDGEYGRFYGKRLLAVRPMVAAELEDLAWDASRGDVPMVMVFEDSLALIPSCDPEGNGPGFLFPADLA